MIEVPPLITDLGLILITATSASLVFKKFGQPQVLGYLIAGLLVSRHIPFLPTVKDRDSIQVWSEIGVIFLLFGLGLEFSFKKLFRVGGSASFTAIFEVIFMITLGYLCGKAFGWTNLDSLFFGAILSISSTTIIVKAFHELGLRQEKYVEFVFGVLVVEDIIAILILVSLTAIARSGAFPGIELAVSGVRLLFYIALWFVVGIFLIPLFLRKIRGLMDDENMLLVSIGLCFSMVMIAETVGFSSALGAFVMGSLLAETPEGHQIENLLQPVKNLFAAIFFVSVGMILDPQVLFDQWRLVVLITLITIIGKFTGTFIGAIISGQSRKRSIQAGLSLAQIGEFSFIIASLGTLLKVTSPFLYPLAIAVSALTTFSTPYLIKTSEVASRWLDGKLPGKIKNISDNYYSSFKEKHKEQILSVIMATYGMKTLINAVIIIAILSGFKTITKSAAFQMLSPQNLANAILFFLCLILSAPFFWGIVMSGPTLSSPLQFEKLHKLRRTQFTLFVGRSILALILLAVIIDQFSTFKLATGLIAALVVFALLSSQSWMRSLYQVMEKNFLNNLSEKERKEILGSKMAKHLLPWDTALGVYELTPDSTLAGKSLGFQSFRENYGITVAAVFRGSHKYFAPAGNFILWPYDKLLCFGDDINLRKFSALLEAEKESNLASSSLFLPQEDYILKSFTIGSTSPFINKSIKDSSIRDHLSGLVVGIERGPQKILGPTANFVFREHDLVWIVLDKSKPSASREQFAGI